MSDFLPLKLKADSVNITKAGKGWEIVITLENGVDLTLWKEQPDGIYDQLFHKEILEVDDGKIKMVNHD